MKPINTQKEYQDYVNKKSPNSPILRNCLSAFGVGGLICSLGQLIMEVCKYRGLDNEISATITSIILIFLSAFLTALNLFNKIGKFAGAGSLVPITGFAHSMMSAALDYKKEGMVTGIGANMFKLTGSVIIFGVVSAYVFGLIRILLFGGTI